MMLLDCAIVGRAVDLDEDSPDDTAAASSY